MIVEIFKWRADITPN